jgi:hypothetical protein
MYRSTGTVNILYYPQNSIFIFFIFYSQFAYHEATYFLVRLLQEFTGFTLDKSLNIKPPAEWAASDGLKGTDKVSIGSHITMFVRVSIFHEIKIRVTDFF